jgi:hypothetical protein
LAASHKLTDVSEFFGDMLECLRRRGGGCGEEVVPKVVRRAHFNEGGYDALGELEHLTDPLAARLLAALILAFEPEKVKLRSLRQRSNSPVGLLDSVACVDDGIRECLYVMSCLRGGKKQKNNFNFMRMGGWIKDVQLTVVCVAVMDGCMRCEDVLRNTMHIIYLGCYSLQAS